MRALLRKELRLLLPVLGLPLLGAVVWIAVGDFDAALLGPTREAQIAAWATALVAGAAFGLVQFGAERWGSTLGYLLHRSIGPGRIFALKVAVGCAASLVAAWIPVAAFGLWGRAFHPHGGALQGTRLVELGVLGTAALPAYAVAVWMVVFEARKDRQLAFTYVSLCGLFALTVPLLLLQEAVVLGLGASALVFVAVQLALAAMLLELSRRHVGPGVDPDLPLPRGERLVLAGVFGLVLFQPWSLTLTGAARALAGALTDRYPDLAWRAEREFARAVPAGSGWRAVDAERRPLDTLSMERLVGTPSDPDTWARLWSPKYGAPEPAPKTTPERPSGAPGARDLEPPVPPVKPVPLGREWSSLLSASFRVGRTDVRGVRAWLDRTAGAVTLALFDAPLESGLRYEVDFDPGAGGELPRVASLRPADGRPLSPRTFVIRPHWVESWTESFRAPALFDPDRRALWTLDLETGARELSAAALPEGDRVAGWEPVYRRTDLRRGLWHAETYALVGERGRYLWDGRAVVPLDGADPELLALGAARGAASFDFELAGRDGLRPRARVIDRATGALVFAHAYEPRGALERACYVGRLAITVLQPFSVLLASHLTDGDVHAVRERVWLRDPLLYGGSRPGLLALGLAVSLAFAALVVRVVAPAAGLRTALAWSAGVLVFGPPMAYLAAVVERAPARREPEAREDEAEPAPSRSGADVPWIQSA